MMRNVPLAACITVLGWTASAAAQHVQPGSASASSAPPVHRSQPIATLNGFVSNRGQWAPPVLYLARCDGIEATLLPDALVFRPTPELPARDAAEPAPPPLPPLVLRLPHAATAEGEGILPTEHNFILGSGTTSHVPGFERVVYRDVVPGIDVVVRQGERGFEYDLHVAPGADLGSLSLTVEGADSMQVEEGGVLVLQTPAGRVEQRIGAAWQTEGEGGAQSAVASRFLALPPVNGELRFGFAAPGRDARAAFVLDPSLVYATYVGGSSQDLFADMRVAGNGAVYLACKSFNTPTTPGAVQATMAGIVDAWVGKLSPHGTSLEWGTFIGGSEAEIPIGLDVDSDGNVVVAGQTFSTDFPTTAGCLQPVGVNLSNQNELFVSRLAADGSSLIWSTYYGGPGLEQPKAIAISPSGDVLLAAETDDPSPPATPGAFDTVYTPHDQMIIRFSADGSTLVFQTYFAANGIRGFACDEAGNIYFSGEVMSQYGTQLPATPGALKTTMVPGDPGNGFVAKLNPLGTQLLWATYVGGDEGDDIVRGMAIDAASAVYVAGLTTSDDFPVTTGAFSAALTGGDEGFVAKLLPGGTGLVWSTYIGSCCGGSGFMDGVVVDTAGNSIVVGRSNETGYPTTPDAFQANNAGPFPSSDAVLTKFDAVGATLVYSTWFGGGGADNLSRVGLDAAQQPYLGVYSTSSNIPVTPGAYQPTYGGFNDMVVAKFSLPLLPWKVLGGGMQGSVDTANLAGTGPLTPGSLTRLALRGATRATTVYLVAGLTVLDAPFKGGTLVPAPNFIVPLAANGQGALDVSFVWPSVPAGVTLTLQVWMHAPGSLSGWGASNGLQLASQ